MGFVTPTPIQAAALPPALAGRDVLAAAMTGSGKTAAFVLPILQRLMQRTGRAGTRALVLTPTRELAAQVNDHLTALGRHSRITATTVFGGVKPAAQIRALRSGVDVVVATPGRLLDHMNQPWFSIDRLEVLVLDEADRMLDMGFLPDVRRILGRLPERRQTMLFSATMPRPIVELSRDLLVRPVRLDVERPAAPATGIRHAVLPVAETDKKGLLLEMLQHGDVGTALVFTRTKHRANRLAKFLAASGIRCDRIHGNRSQPQREAALADFKQGRIQVLVATDIAARGIDVEALPCVVNFDVPRQPEDYIHRVGRTARAETTGDALTLVAPDEEGDLRAIERAVGRRLDLHPRSAGGRRHAPARAARVASTPVPRVRPKRPLKTTPRVTDWPTTVAGPEPSGALVRSSHMTGARRTVGRPEEKRMRMSKKLFVGSLSWDTDDQSLRDAFAPHGEVTEARVITDRHSGRSRGFGFVTFADDEAADKAMAALNQQELDGRTIRVDVAQDRDRGSDRGRSDQRSW
jgi:ATP-dependent RNA helicase RhlE